ncbi:NADH-quinone oxidoreductase subunit N [Desulfurispirillum indicum]|uniref:NADH-quinone oxidoreductase subunit N n=1 Tax=Desulfurispirillum indicum (strain ATCC BAA-1389 / DSM 22839 / S5) TaxID=653733 RepID=E6W132_DESIS|nr:NADH-quinone oxidoreductase subunit N [Desulfurispirillum indicum]ADU65364.1 proton-translocating NADH-quinone oxidoreductase, chain N [Desulfurispirillum indicum S5]UCZ57259.1 NADH-quinone oxidoreductase subunit N [Desulfurispirillum indicum]
MTHQADLIMIFPELLVIAAIFIATVADLFIRKENKHAVGYMCILGLIAALAVLIGIKDYATTFTYSGMFEHTGYSWWFRVMMLCGGILTLMMSFVYARERQTKEGEFYYLIAIATLGGMVLAGAGNMVTVFLGLELLSITSYVLVGMQREKAFAAEASFKYMLYGAVSSAVMLFGFAIIFGLTGTLNLAEAGAVLGQVLQGESSPAATMAMIMVLGGLGYKLAVVPFHQWCPDVYQGASYPVTAFLSVVSKIAGFAIIIRLIDYVFMGNGLDALAGQWAVAFAVIAAASMILGNMAALAQTNVKRLLAYSSISHAGYVLVGIVAFMAVNDTPANIAFLDGATSAVFYLFGYLFMNIGAFAGLMHFSRMAGSAEISDIAGLAKRSPAVAFVTASCFVSLAGLPPFIGFLGKFYLFGAAVQSGYIWLALLGLLMSIVSLFYYAKVIKALYFDEQTVELKETSPSGAGVTSALGFSFAGILLTMFLAEPIINVIRWSMERL